MSADMIRHVLLDHVTLKAIVPLRKRVPKQSSMLQRYEKQAQQHRIAKLATAKGERFLLFSSCEVGNDSRVARVQ